jgi:hypothetical protein
MHKGYTYQIYNYVCLQKKLQEYNVAQEHNTRQSNILENWTLVLWRILLKYSTSFLPQAHPTQNHPTQQTTSTHTQPQPI